MRLRLALAMSILLATSGCARAEDLARQTWRGVVSLFDQMFHRAPPAPAAAPHYLVGEPYAAGGIWYYPREQFDYDATGIAAIVPPGHGRLTADGELFDANAMAAAHPTLQLPAIARVTDLETGRQVLVRINDRGPASPARLIEVTPRVAALLGFGPAGIARVRVELDETLSETLAAELQAHQGGPAVASAPRTGVQSAALEPPRGVAAAPPGRPAPAAKPSAAAEPSLPMVPARLPETVVQGAPAPGQIWILGDSFDSYGPAMEQRNRLGRFGARVVRTLREGRENDAVMIGPIGTVAEADALLAQVIGAGVVDAHLIVQQE